MGRFLSRGCREDPIHFLVPQFLCSTWRKPVSSSRPTMDGAGARRSGSRMARERHRKALVLAGSEHDGTIAVVGDDDIEGSPRVVHDCSCHILVCGGYRDPDHDAVMRIGSKLRGGGPILHNGMRAVVSPGTPPPRTVIGDLSQTVRTGCENCQAFLCDLPFNVRDGGRRPGARRHLARGATRR